MTKFLISFPSGEMHIPDGEFDDVVRDSHAVVQEAKDAGVWVFGGGIDESVAPVMVDGDGVVFLFNIFYFNNNLINSFFIIFC